MAGPDFSKPATLISASIAVAVIICAIGWVLSKVLEPLAQAVSIIVQGIALGIGIGTGAVATGLAAGGATSSWLPSVASIGVAAGGVSVAYVLVVKTVREVGKRPYEWLLPALVLLAVFFTDLMKEDLIVHPVGRAAFALSTGVFSILGGLLLLQRRRSARFVGCIFPFVPPLIIGLWLRKQEHTAHSLMASVQAGDPGAMAFLGILAVSLVIVVLGVWLPLQQEEGSTGRGS